MNQKKYQKPRIVAKSAPKKSYVAGCPSHNRGSRVYCESCEMDIG